MILKKFLFKRIVKIRIQKGSDFAYWKWLFQSSRHHRRMLFQKDSIEFIFSRKKVSKKFKSVYCNSITEKFLIWTEKSHWKKISNVMKKVEQKSEWNSKKKNEKIYLSFFLLLRKKVKFVCATEFENQAKFGKMGTLGSSLTWFSRLSNSSSNLLQFLKKALQFQKRFQKMFSLPSWKVKNGRNSFLTSEFIH